MKFEEVDGKQHIIIEENDNVSLTVPSAKGNTIDIKGDGKKIAISGDSILISKISGKGMLEKVEIPSIIPVESILEKCDQWLEMFKSIHDIFSKLTLSEKYRKQDIVMELSFGNFFSVSDSSVKGRTINLDMKKWSSIVLEGMTISVDEEDEDIYKYLAANVIAYYLEKNYVDTQIDLTEFNWTLYSSEKTSRGNTVPMIAGLGSWNETSDYERLAISLISCHNVGASAEQIIANLRNRITNQQLSHRIESGIDHSSKQFEKVKKMK